MPQKSHQNQTLPQIKPLSQAHLALTSWGSHPEQDTGPWRTGSQLRSPQCSSPLSSTQPWSQLFVPAVPYSFDKFMFFLVLMLL